MTQVPVARSTYFRAFDFPIFPIPPATLQISPTDSLEIRHAGYAVVRLQSVFSSRSDSFPTLLPSFQLNPNFKSFKIYFVAPRH
jgi:hypothetical protein